MSKGRTPFLLLGFRDGGSLSLEFVLSASSENREEAGSDRSTATMYHYDRFPPRGLATIELSNTARIVGGSAVAEGRKRWTAVDDKARKEICRRSDMQ
jgi:hypothetical protein